jgi:hypothetical protein
VKGIQIHPSVELAWALANREAQLSGSSRVEPVHFLLAILHIIHDCSLQDAEALGLPRDAIDEIATISKEVRRVVGLPDDRITAMRRKHHFSAPAWKRFPAHFLASRRGISGHFPERCNAGGGKQIQDSQLFTFAASLTGPDTGWS